jgi:hypothetical protein
MHPTRERPHQWDRPWTERQAGLVIKHPNREAWL